MTQAFALQHAKTHQPSEKPPVTAPDVPLLVFMFAFFVYVGVLMFAGTIKTPERKDTDKE
jgi:hypothetical protein